jgi:hypothetical protein
LPSGFDSLPAVHGLVSDHATYMVVYVPAIKVWRITRVAASIGEAPSGGASDAVRVYPPLL